MKLVNLDHFAFEREREHMHIQCTNSQSFNEHQCITAMAGTRNFIMQSVQDCWTSPECMHISVALVRFLLNLSTKFHVQPHDCLIV